MDQTVIILTSEQLEKILDEIADFHIDLEEDPTLPHLGNKYLQRILAQCRQYLNRVHFYLQQTRRYEKYLRNEVKKHELDLDFKLKHLVADDNIVRQQPAYGDRVALATSMLKTEHGELATFRVNLQDVEETAKLIRAKYDELNRTNGDIKLQRQLVKDDKSDQMMGGEGYSRPQVNQDRTVPGGLTPPVGTKLVSPTDLLDPNSRPDDLPVAIDGAHAQMISDFFAQQTPKSVPIKPDPPNDNAEVAKNISYDDLL